MSFVEKLMHVSLLVLAALMTSVSPFKDDLVTNLPGQPASTFRVFSGYVTVDENHGRALFYFFAEARNNPQSKPLTLWLNGGSQIETLYMSVGTTLCHLISSGLSGPGCSSVGVGAFYENGPFFIRKNALATNTYSWNSESNMLYLESPAGVLFSDSNTSSDYHLNDEKTSTLLPTQCPQCIQMQEKYSSFDIVIHSSTCCEAECCVIQLLDPDWHSYR
ncbi:hypothetical protein Mapa_012595 [Marchantia paleacea]|nr:hypothetical protein Mapa_012595 [Marchantia paleacea]